MYQIVRGVICVEKRMDGADVRLGLLRASETFGELSFLAGSAATASCLVESEEAELVIMEGYYLNMLFRIRPEIAGRFYKFLSLLVTARVFNSQHVK
jgi:CRP-like cAMP-binding protein